MHSFLPKMISLVAVGLVVAGLIIPPPGIIDPSVLTAVGLLLGFRVVAMVPSLIESSRNVTVVHGNTSVSVSKHPGDGEEDEDPC